MAKQGNTYTNPQIRALGEQRRLGVSASFAAFPGTASV